MANVEMIIGRAGAGKTFACLQRMKKILSEDILDTEIIFLLPAYQTYRAELELAKITGGAVNTRMYSFQRFARQILSEVGGAIIPRISEVGRRLLLRKILLNHVKADDLKYYNRAARQRSFAENLAQELQEFRTYSIDAEKIFEVLEQVEDEELSNKLHDLAVLFDDFRKICEGKQNDDSDLIEKAAAEIKNSAAIKRTEIFIDGFIFFDPQQRKILRELFQHAKNVHIVLPISANLNDKENTSRTGIFNRAFETFKMLKNLADEVHAEFEITRCEKSVRFENPALKFVEENFFEHRAKTFSGGVKDLKIVEAVNKRVEVEQVAREILKLRGEKNFRFRDIGIISRDESYNNLIKPIFEMHNIPYFADSKSAAIHHPLAELIRSTMETLRGWRAESIFRCLRTGFFDTAADDIDFFENYVIEFGLRGEKVWTTDKVWTWHRHSVDEPADGTPSQSEIERLEKIDSIRRSATNLLIKFSAAVKKKKSARELTAELFKFLESLKVPSKLETWSAEEEQRGNLSLSKEHLKIWDDVVTLFEQIVDALGEEVLDAKEFESILNEGLDALQMSLIPPGLDEVTVSQFDQNSLQNSKAIFILGFGDNNFPKQATEKFLLSDADRLHLNDYKIEISRGGRETMLAEKFLVYRGLTLAKNFLQISSPLADAEGKAARAASLRDKFLKLFPNLKVELADLEILNSLGSEVEYSVGEREISAESAEKLFAPYKKMQGSVTRFETFNKCPFQYFVQYGLDLKERREYKVFNVDIGNILHEVMKKFGEDLKAENKRWGTVTDAELEKRVTKIVEDFANNLNNKILLSTNAGKRRRERIKKVAIYSLKRLVELDRHSKFHPELFEETFNALGKQRLVYKIKDTEMELTGKIDRVDFSEDGNYFMIIDYKTGTAELNLKEIFAGINLQLLTYLMVTNKLEEVGKKLPAAMFYFFLKYPVKQRTTFDEATQEVDKELKPIGWLLNDEKILVEIDESQKIIKIPFNQKGGGVNKTFADNNLKSSEDFQALMSYIDDILKETGERILNGFIKTKPFQIGNYDTCNFCAYTELCNFNSKTDRHRLSALSDNKEILKRIKEHKTGLNF